MDQSLVKLQGEVVNIMQHYARVTKVVPARFVTDRDLHDDFLLQMNKVIEEIERAREELNYY